MGARTWEMERDLGIARHAVLDLRARAAAQVEVDRARLEVERLEVEIVKFQTACKHRDHPERPGQCFECGASCKGPMLAKAREDAATLRRVG